MSCPAHQGSRTDHLQTRRHMEHSMRLQSAVESQLHGHCYAFFCSQISYNPSLCSYVPVIVLHMWGWCRQNGGSLQTYGTRAHKKGNNQCTSNSSLQNKLLVNVRAKFGIPNSNDKGCSVCICNTNTILSACIYTRELEYRIP